MDFYQYYINGRLEELKFRMDENLYPPRCKARVQAKHKSFFESPKSLDFQLAFDEKRISRKIIIPSNNGMLIGLNQEVIDIYMYINRYV